MPVAREQPHAVAVADNDQPETIVVGNDQAPDFTPVASYPSLTPEVRARLNDMKVAPARADTAANNAATSEVTRTPLPAATIAPKPVPARDKRVNAD
jgi:hypothetical protein